MNLKEMLFYTKEIRFKHLKGEKVSVEKTLELFASFTQRINELEGQLAREKEWSAQLKKDRDKLINELENRNLNA